MRPRVTGLTYYCTKVDGRLVLPPDARALCLCLARNPGAGVSARSRPTTHTMSATLPFAPAADETEMDYSDMAEALGEFGVAAPKVDAYALMEDSRPAIPLPNGEQYVSEEEDEQMKEAFFSALEARHGRHLTYREDLRHWEASLSDGEDDSVHPDDSEDSDEMMDFATTPEAARRSAIQDYIPTPPQPPSEQQPPPPPSPQRQPKAAEEEAGEEAEEQAEEAEEAIALPKEEKERQLQTCNTASRHAQYTSEVAYEDEARRLFEGPEHCAAEPATAEPVAAEPVTPEPVAPEPVAAGIAAAEPVTPEPVAAEPLPAEPVAAEPVAGEPVAAEPVTPEPLPAEPVAAEIATERMRELVPVREAEMRQEILQLRATKRELESKLAEVNLASYMRQLQAEQEATAAAKAALEANEEAHRKEVATLHAKIGWYTENQTLIDEVEAQREAAEAKVAALQRQLEARRVDDAAEKEDADSKQVVMLEKQVAMQQRAVTALSEPAPDAKAASRVPPPASKRGSSRVRPIAELIAAAGPTAEEVQRTEYLTTRIQNLEAQLSQLEGANQKRLRALRQQHERVAAGYESRIASLTKTLAKYQAEGRHQQKTGQMAERHADRVRVRELEKQLEEVRATCGQRVSELESKLAEANKAASRRAGGVRAQKQGGDGSRARLPSSGGQQSTCAAEQCAASAAEDELVSATAADQSAHQTDGGAPTLMDHSAIDRIGELAAALDLELQRLEGSISDIDRRAALPLRGNVPSAVESSSEMTPLHTKLQEYETRQRMREAEVSELIESTKRLERDRRETERTKHEMMCLLEGKNAELDAFRCELDAILLDIQVVHAKHAQHVALSAQAHR